MEESQMNLRVPAELKKKIQMIALRDGTTITLIISSLMQRYVKEDEAMVIQS